MDNKERVIKALESCGKNNADCEHCPYYDERDCIHKVMRAALFLLVEPNREDNVVGISYCPYCKKPTKIGTCLGINFCQECGHMLIPRKYYSCPKCHSDQYVTSS